MSSRASSSICSNLIRQHILASRSIVVHNKEGGVSREREGDRHRQMKRSLSLTLVF